MGQSPDSRQYNHDQQGKPFLQGCAEFTDYYPVAHLYCTQQTKIAPAGSVLFSVRAPVAKMNVADREYVIGRGLAAIMGTGIDQEYLRHYLASVESAFELLAQGSTFSAINGPVLRASAVRYPADTSAQGKIATVLSTIDKAIAQTEVLIVKHQRIKTALMQNLLTRGIDEHGNLRSEENQAFKDSPLGRIPVQWDQAQLGEIASRITSGARDWSRYYSVEGARFIRVGNLTRDRVDMRLDDQVFVCPPRLTEADRTSLREGDLLISIDL